MAGRHVPHVVSCSCGSEHQRRGGATETGKEGEGEASQAEGTKEQRGRESPMAGSRRGRESGLGFGAVGGR